MDVKKGRFEVVYDILHGDSVRKAMEHVRCKKNNSDIAFKTWLFPLKVVAVDQQIIYVGFYELAYVPYRVYFFWDKVALVNAQKERLN